MLSRTILLILMFSTACKSDLSVMVGDVSSRKDQDPKVYTIDRITAQPGDVVEVLGSNFQSGMIAEVGGTSVGLQITSPTTARFTMPNVTISGTHEITFRIDNGQSLGIFSLASNQDDKLPVIDIDPGIICTDTIFRSPKNQLKRGLRNCAATLPFCQKDGDSDCVAANGFVSANKNYINPGFIRKGYTVAGVAGDFPSATYPLEVVDASTDLKSSTFNSQMQNQDALVWFDRSGQKHNVTGPGIQANILKSGVSALGVTGSYAPACSSDGEQDCKVEGLFKAVNTASLSAWDIRRGKSAGGIAGKIEFRANMARTGVFNRTAGQGSSAGTDFYDSMDDWAANTGMPTESLPGLPSYTVENWIRNASTDSGAGGGIAGNGICDGSEVCIYDDRLTGLSVSPVQTPATWEQAINTCEAMTLGGSSDWRLPTQKEMLGIGISGFSAISLPLGTTPNATVYLWSSTTVSGVHGNAYVVASAFALFHGMNAKTDTNWYHCIRNI